MMFETGRSVPVQVTVFMVTVWSLRLELQRAADRYPRLMVTLSEIDDVHERLGKADTLPAYCHALAELGVVAYDSYVSDGRTVFRTSEGSDLDTGPNHELVAIAPNPDHAAVHDTLALAGAGELGYAEMSRLLGSAGLERWSVDTRRQVMTYIDVLGEAVLVEQLE